MIGTMMDSCEDGGVGDLGVSAAAWMEAGEQAKIGVGVKEETVDALSNVNHIKVYIARFFLCGSSTHAFYVVLHLKTSIYSSCKTFLSFGLSPFCPRILLYFYV